MSSGKNEKLVQAIQNGEDVENNLEQLYKQNRGIIFHYARKYVDGDEDIEDYLNEGYFAVMEAAKKYKPEKGAFNTFLGYQLLKTFTTYQGKTNPGGIPLYVYEDIIKYKRALSVLEAETGRTPTPEETAERAGLSTARLNRLQSALLYDSPTSLYKIVSALGEEETELIDFMPDEYDLESEVVEKVFREQIEKKGIWKICEKVLSPREMEAIRWKYVEDMPVYKLGEKWGVSGTMANIVYNRAMNKLKYNRHLFKPLIG